MFSRGNFINLRNGKYWLVLLYLFFVFSSNANERKFPKPSGSFEVGTKKITLNVFGQTRNKRHEYGLHAQIWYPSEKDITNIEPYEYDPGSFVELLPRFKKIGFKLEDISKISTFSRENVPIRSGKKIPLVIYSHGLGMDKESNTVICEELASYGFMVLAVDHTDYVKKNSFLQDVGSVFNEIDFMIKKTCGKIDPRQDYSDDIDAIIQFIFDADQKAEDMDFIDRVDKGRIGIFGHSFGGGSSVRAVLENDKIGAGVSLDGIYSKMTLTDLSKDLRKPMLFVLSEELFSSCLDKINVKDRSLYKDEAKKKQETDLDLTALKVDKNHSDEKNNYKIISDSIFNLLHDRYLLGMTKDFRFLPN
ncbi:hypothetical protein OAB57_03565 [Bacteriovoracaceae bacterium]|nr:hypothetical protein [Bacteriovoracaceae bacterium]